MDTKHRLILKLGGKSTDQKSQHLNMSVVHGLQLYS